ncbi:hypothetical protein HU200_020647 [Digitaria exilis]|uniref:FACT complex subunit SSRP1 n=1 Tax=Digitaria exilis TaxID=1010633 RepID=A0A835F0X4_9POAL|nr:hypothetical protein HU200_020647 [Digitaria exilis]
MTDGHHFNNIYLGGRGGGVSPRSASLNPGQFKLYSGGLAWKKQGGGKVIEVDKTDIRSVTWMKIPKSYQLSVGTKEGLCYRFFGFREQDVSSLTSFIQKSTGITPEEKQLSISGHNWGGIEINGNMLCFNVGSKEAFEVSLADVSQTQMQGKTDVVLEFHVDDTTGANEKDSLMDLSFHVPTSNTQFIGDEHRTSAQILFSHTTLILLWLSHLIHLFAKDKHCILTLLFRKLISSLIEQFETETVVERELALSEEVLAEKYKDRLESSYRVIIYSLSITLHRPMFMSNFLEFYIYFQGLIHEVFSMVLRGLSGAKVTRPSTFRSCQDGYAVKSSLKAEDGLLYPLEKGFFFLPKPPTLIPHEEIEYVEFERHGAGGASISSHYFDLLVKLKNDQEHLFRNIQRNEYHNLFNFIRTGGVTAVLQSTDDDSVDPHLERIKNQAGNEESDEEDEDFVAEKDDSGSPTDDSDVDGSDASLSGGEKEKSSKKEASSSKPPVKKKQKSVSDEGSQKKKRKKKKDPNAPKRAIAPFMYFSKAERANIKNSNPELATTEIAKKLGERWQKMTAEERQPFIEQSQVDKQRYAEESAAYRGANTQQASGDGSE